jgi:hypothetical protein
MARLKVFMLTVPLLLLTSHMVHAQGMSEYGKVLGNAGQRQGRMNPTASGRSKPQGNDKGVAQGLAGVATLPLPAVLTVESREAALHHRHDEWSDKLVHLAYGETLIPIAETTAGSALWYMVKTQAGLIGWVKSTDVKKEDMTSGGSR